MAPAAQTADRPPYGMIAVLMIGAFIAFLNNTLLNVALPSIMNDLQVSTSSAQWLQTGFMLINGILIPTTAFLIQKFSIRRLFIASLGLFVVGTVLSGFASHFPMLLAGRIIQGSGSAILMPVLMNVMLVSFPIEKRGTAMGVFGFVMMGAPAIGPTLSGWVVEHYNWRMLFHFETPIAVAVFLAGLYLLKDKKDKNDLRLDLHSLLLSTLGFGGLLYGFSAAGSRGWGHPLVYLTILAGAVSLTWFILRQNRLEKPMLNFRIFRYPMYALSAVISMMITMAMFSGMIIFPIYVQTVRGISPLDAGLMMMPGALLMSLMSPVTGKLFDKFGGRVLAVAGLVILTGSTYYFSQLTMETGYFELMLMFAIRMLGMSMVMMPVSTNGLNELPARFYPHGTAMNNSTQQVSGAIGTAFLVTIMATRQAVYTGDALRAMDGEPAAEMMRQIELQAMLGGINDAFLAATVIAGAALVLSFFIKRGEQAEDPGKEQPSGNCAASNGSVKNG